MNIQRTIGRIPILAVGSSDGDLQMLQYSTAHGARSLQVLVHHDDSEREYASTTAPRRLSQRPRSKAG